MSKKWTSTTRPKWMCCITMRIHYYYSNMMCFFFIIFFRSLFFTSLIFNLIKFHKLLLILLALCAFHIFHISHFFTRVNFRISWKNNVKMKNFIIIFDLLSMLELVSGWNFHSEAAKRMRIIVSFWTTEFMCGDQIQMIKF